MWKAWGELTCERRDDPAIEHFTFNAAITNASIKTKKSPPPPTPAPKGPPQGQFKPPPLPIPVDPKTCARNDIVTGFAAYDKNMKKCVSSTSTSGNLGGHTNAYIYAPKGKGVYCTSAPTFNRGNRLYKGFTSEGKPISLDEFGWTWPSCEKWEIKDR